MTYTFRTDYIMLAGGGQWPEFRPGPISRGLTGRQIRVILIYERMLIRAPKEASVDGQG